MNLRPTPASRATPAMLAASPRWTAASAAARTRVALRWLSRRRAFRIASAGSPLTGRPLLSRDIGEQRRRRLGDGAQEPHRDRGVELGSGAAHRGDGLFDLCSFVVGDVGEQFLAPVDDTADGRDLLGGG